MTRATGKAGSESFTSTQQGATLPRVEFRVPISPAAQDMRMVRYLMESIRMFGGPVAKAATFVCSVGADEPERDLAKEFPWTRDYDIRFNWVDRQLFRDWTFDGTGVDRMWLKSDADIVAMIDSDLLVTGNFDDILLQSHETGAVLGFMAHVCPFGFEDMGGVSSQEGWAQCCAAVGIPVPDLTFQYSGWGIDFAKVFPNRPVKILSNNAQHRFGPPYFNYGVIIGSRAQMEAIGDTFMHDLEALRELKDSIYNSQIASALGILRYGFEARTISINYNFPLNIPSDAIRAVNLDPQGGNEHSDIRIFHYIGGRRHFKSPETLDALIDRSKMPGAWPTFQKVLAQVRDRIDETE